MKRVITALLAALLVLSLAACGSGVETKKLAGTWTCTIDVTDRMNAAAEQALGLSAADGTAQMPLQLVLTVTEDGAYTLRYDSDAVRTALDAYAAALHPAAVESVYAAAEEQGLSREEYDAAMEKAGITMDDMVAAIFAGVDEEELLSLLTGRSAAITGYCKAEGGQLYLADTAAELAETADCLSYTLSDVVKENGTTLSSPVCSVILLKSILFLSILAGVPVLKRNISTPWAFKESVR